MANIYCTKKLEKLVGKSLISPESEVSSELGNWNGNIFPIQGRKCLILMNDVTYYSLIFPDILKKDILHLHDLIIQRLIEQFNHDHVHFPIECTPKLIDVMKPRFLRTNNNRKVLGTMTEIVYVTGLFMHQRYRDQLKFIDLLELNGLLNKQFVGALRAGKHNYGVPVDVMRNKINTFCT